MTKQSNSYTTWEEYTTNLIEQSTTNKTLLTVVFDNQHKYHESDDISIEDRKSNADEIINLYNNLVAMNFVGVQPMNGPVSIVYSLQYTLQYSQPKSNPRLEWTFNSIENVYVPVGVHEYEPVKAKRISQEEYDNLIKEYDSSKPSKNDLILSGMARAVEAQQLQLHDNVQLSDQINAHIFSKIVENSTVVETKLPESGDMLAASITSEATNIAINTRRGVGNVILITDSIYKLLKQSSFFVESDTFNPGSFVFAGMLMNTKVFYTNTSDKNTVLMGYKGSKGEISAGMIYSPYISIMQVGNGKLSRFGISTLHNSECELSNTNNYYRFIKYT